MQLNDFLFIEAVVQDHRWADLRMRCSDEDALISMTQLLADYNRLKDHYPSLAAYVDEEVYLKTFGV